MFIFSNLAISVDGKIGTADRCHLPLGTPKDRDQMQVLRRRADAILIGAESLRAFRKFCRAGGKKGPQPANVILSSSLQGISPEWPFFEDSALRRILFVTSDIPAARARRFEKTSELIRLRPTRLKPFARQVVDALAQRGMEKLLVEGGGGVMWGFVESNLIDEYHVTVTPWIVGGTDTPTLVDGKGFSPGELLKLELVRARRIGNELFLVYRRPGPTQRKR